MKLTLSTWQRIMCVLALNGQTGHISAVRKALKLLDILELSNEERTQIGFQEPAPGQYTWGDVVRRFDLEIADRELVAFLRRAVDAYQGWPVEHGREVVDLFQQLGVDEPTTSNS